ncbi:hypothetical protein KZX45_12400 [Georgenia sp. EYE_87]|uniref:hypothetical protein n=1 Tax=Georgenia sp. EYE_87 TaxID=2853448 RepID=UPI00200564E3|nr:hypothetical protein [Georgenia sp. EYE_87]MCK6211343.1 hypothetical protein [Georgenia sp. EYE_87]
MSTVLVTGSGTPVKLAKEIGRGGEGSVFTISARPDRVAKVYHRPPDRERQSKLQLMANNADDTLLSFVAWPETTLHDQRGTVVGFVMPKLADDQAPVHAFYSPAHRKAEHPGATWEFLLLAARNTAAAFAVVHNHGHVIGDVNQNGIYVAKDARISLVDADSFQISDPRGSLYRCKVGVPEFTPPELQDSPSLAAVTRAPNHDNFGLAVLIFHLLFAGRHPYAGVPLLDHVGADMTTDIRHLRYAYSADSQSRGLTPPPRSVPASVVPGEVQKMFYEAFTEKGLQGGRPSATQWKHALDEVRRSIRNCNVSRTHRFPGNLRACPWCALEGQGVTLFIDLGTKVTYTQSGFVLEKAWALVERVQAPPPIPQPVPERIDVEAKPLPPGVPSRGNIRVLRILVVAITVGLVAGLPDLALWMFLVGVAGWAGVTARAKPLKAERRSREAELQAAQEEFQRQTSRLERETIGRFHSRRQELAGLADEYRHLAEFERRQLAKLDATVRERQLLRHLQAAFIDTANIRGLGPTRKAALRSFGIETAADIDATRIRQVRGFGDALTHSMVAWRREQERRFRFDPNHPSIKADRDATKATFQVRRRLIEQQLQMAPNELSRIAREASARAAVIQPHLEGAAQRLAQARTDLRMA